MSGWLAPAALGFLCLVPVDAASGAEDIAALVAPYTEARGRGRLGEVSGSAQAEPRSPDGAPLPYESVVLTLLPHSPALEEELDGIKAALRDSHRTYLDAAGRVAAAREAWERTLLAAGSGDLVRGQVTSASGQFRFSAVPAGRWLLLAWRSVEHVAAGRKAPRREADRFVGNLERAGHVVVTHWRARVDVLAGGEVHVALTDRNAWMTGVRERSRPAEPEVDAGRRGRGTAR